jgi:3-deoxy-manno-octulosonate cytidylyltransferase (CMP-KDO synthetase)
MAMKILGVIPARYGSTRLEGKPLKDICGKPMIQHVYERAARASFVDELVVATDDSRIVEAVNRFGGTARLTSTAHKTGTDRIEEVARSFDAEIVINIQGDEPLLDPRMIDELAQPMVEDPSIPAGTLCAPIVADEKLDDPNVVKVVFDRNGFALYFSRSLIPYPRKRDSFKAYEHIGVYAYRTEFLRTYVKTPQTPLESIELLEQLRILETGHRLLVLPTRFDYLGLSVDTVEDLEQVRRIVAAEKAGRGKGG